MNIVNGFDAETLEAIMMLASDLADIFEDNILEKSYQGAVTSQEIVEQTVLISEQGIEKLGDAFGEVIEPLRASVFEHLLLELESRDIDYDIDQFRDDA